MRTLAILAALALTMIACQVEPQPPADQPQHPLLENLEPPPLNRPVTVTTKPGEQVAPRLPAGEQAALLLLQDGRPFSGTLRASGELTVGDSVIDFRPAQGAALQILYRTPRGLPSLRAESRPGRLDVVERSRPEGADRRVVVSDDAGLVLAQIWRSSPRPLQVELPGGLALAQASVAPQDTAAGYTEVPLQARVRGERVATLAIGQAVSVRTGAGPVQVLTEVSHRFVPDDPQTAQYPGGYILHVWVTRSE